LFRNASLRLRTASAAVAGCLLAAPAAAQQPAGSRLPSGLFGGGVGESGQALSLGVSGGGGYNTTESSDPGLSAAGNGFGHVAGNLDYSLVRTRVGLRAGASSSAHYYSDAQQAWPARHVVGVAANAALPLTGRTTLSLSQSLNYQPMEIVSLFPALAAPGLGVGSTLPIDPDLTTRSEGFVTADSNADLTYQLSRRSAVSLEAGYGRRGRFFDRVDLTTLQGGARFSHELSRGLRMRLGYGYTRGDFGDVADSSAQFDNHQIDVGVDYDRSLSLTRRTALSFSTGSVVLSDRNQYRFHFNGRAALRHDMGRTWRTSLAYHRGAEFVGTLRAPVLADSVSAGLNGFLGRQVRAHGTVGASRGDIGLGQDNGFASYYASAGVTIGLTQYLGLDVRYAFLRADFDAPALLVPGLAAHFDRQSLRASIRLWAPLFNRTRRANAAG
jgi:hypothetical protein